MNLLIARKSLLQAIARKLLFLAITTQEIIDEEVARSAAPNPQDFDRAMKGIY